MKEEIKIPFIRYRDNNEQQTCACNIKTKEYCAFLQTTFFGTKEVCGFNNAILNRRSSDDGQEGLGTIIPDKNCIMWSV